MQKNEIVIIIPCFNEENSIIEVYKKTLQYGKVLIIDDYSSDNTRKILKKKKIRFLKNTQNIGYEASIIKAIKYVIKHWKSTRYIATMDADGELRPKFIPKLMNNLIKNNLDIIVGSRNKMNRFSELILKLIFWLKFNIKDPISGLKVYKLDVLKKIINKISKNLFLVDILVISYYYKFKISSTKTKVSKREGKAKVGNNFLVNMKILNISLYSILSKA